MMGVLIPSVMALRETAMTAPLDQQGEPFAPLFHKVGFALRPGSILILRWDFHTT